MSLSRLLSLGGPFLRSNIYELPAFASPERLVKCSDVFECSDFLDRSDFFECTECVVLKSTATPSYFVFSYPVGSIIISALGSAKSTMIGSETLITDSYSFTLFSYCVSR